MYFLNKIKNKNKNKHSPSSISHSQNTTLSFLSFTASILGAVIYLFYLFLIPQHSWLDTHGAPWCLSQFSHSHYLGTLDIYICFALASKAHPSTPLPFLVQEPFPVAASSGRPFCNAKHCSQVSTHSTNGFVHLVYSKYKLSTVLQALGKQLCGRKIPTSWNLEFRGQILIKSHKYIIANWTNCSKGKLTGC